MTKQAGFKKEQANAVTQVLEDIGTSGFITKGYLITELVTLETRLIKFMFTQSVVIVSLTVVLIKFL